MDSPKESRPTRRERALALSEHIYRSLLRAYPRGFRDGYGDEMACCFRDLSRAALTDGGGFGLVVLWTGVLPELLVSAVKERSAMLARNAYRAAVGLAVAAALFLVWGSVGMGIIGADGDPANAMFFGVLAVGVVGAVVARFRPQGMALALFATAIAQALVATIALVLGLGLPWSPPLEILWLNGFYVALFVGSAMLFRYAARPSTPAGAG